MPRNFARSFARACRERALLQSFLQTALEIALHVVRAAAEHGACASVMSLRVSLAASRMRRLDSLGRTQGG
eukprot:4616727-Pyramimonas_sp.AAC.1